jgi:hypothetical protein
VLLLQLAVGVQLVSLLLVPPVLVLFRRLVWTRLLLKRRPGLELECESLLHGVRVVLENAARTVLEKAARTVLLDGSQAAGQGGSRVVVQGGDPAALPVGIVEELRVVLVLSTAPDHEQCRLP